jgi:hypothetical protein
LALLPALLLIAGCGHKPKLVLVTGRVVHQGQPLTAGSIWFHPTASSEYQGQTPSCLLALDGSFTMRTYPFGNGVPPGSYKVTLAPELANRIGRPDCGNPDKTPLQVDVTEQGIQDYVVDVK